MNKGELEINTTDELNKELNKLIQDPSTNKPSEEEIEAAKVEFEEAAKQWSTNTYKIGLPEDAQEICDYMRHFIRNRFLWQKEAWMGVIKLSEELDASEKLFKGNKDKSFEIGYQALEFCFYILTNPSGIGLDSAISFESESDIYVKTLTAVNENIEDSRAQLKNIEFLQQKWGAMSQGFYLEVEPPMPDDLKEETEFEDFNTEE